MDAIPISVTINNQVHSLVPAPSQSLLEYLREDLALTGTKYGCGEGQCDACTVLVNGQPHASCQLKVLDVSGKSVLTIEGLAKGDQLHPVQQAFLDENAFQCGYCTPGMILATVALLAQNPHPSEDQIKAALNGHICRCCGYARQIQAVRRAAGATP